MVAADVRRLGTSKSEMPNPSPKRRDASLRSAATNRVLTLNGSTNSFVELPPDLLAGAHEMTFEAWLKWDEFGNHPTAFASGDRSRNLILALVR